MAHLSFQGATEMGGGRPIDENTIYRIYSMTKPVTSVAAMMLFEEGALRLDHEVYRYIPEFQDVMVMGDGWPAAQAGPPDDGARPVPAHVGPHLFLHRADAGRRDLSRSASSSYSSWKGDLKSFCEALAQAPLVFSPGDRWNYSNSTDVLGRVVEVASGMSLDQFFQTRIFGPLGMKDTGFHVPAESIDRLMACYARNPDTGVISLADRGGAASRYATRAERASPAAAGLPPPSATISASA